MLFLKWGFFLTNNDYFGIYQQKIEKSKVSLIKIVTD